MAEPELKSCPFCGVPLEIRSGKNPYGRHPRDSECIMAAHAVNIPHDVERWNRRAAASTSTEGAGVKGLTMWAEVVETYEGDGVEWRCSEESGCDSDERPVIELAANTFPVGTRVEISEPPASKVTTQERNA